MSKEHIDEEWALCRLYFNRSNDPEGPWSVDQGPGTVELIFQSVQIMARNPKRGTIGITVYEPDGKDPKSEAIAWIEMRNVNLVSEGRKLIIEI